LYLVQSPAGNSSVERCDYLYVVSDPGRPDAKNLAPVVTTDASRSNVILPNLRGGLPEAYRHRPLHCVDGMHGSCLECFAFYSYLLSNSTALLS
jgi:hypothetical protein